MESDTQFSFNIFVAIRDIRSTRYIICLKADISTSAVCLCNLILFCSSLQGGVELTPVAIKAGKLLAHRMFGKGTQYFDYRSVSRIAG